MDKFVALIIQYILVVGAKIFSSIKKNRLVKELSQVELDSNLSYVC